MNLCSKFTVNYNLHLLTIMETDLVDVPRDYLSGPMKEVIVGAAGGITQVLIGVSDQAEHIPTDALQGSHSISSKCACKPRHTPAQRT
jgi:hypothetical protein